MTPRFFYMYIYHCISVLLQLPWGKKDNDAENNGLRKWQTSLTDCLVDKKSCMYA